jgi:hypothetical protein
MAMIHINRNRENLGKFQEQDVSDGLRSGRFLPTDLAWRDPMETWQPLSAFTDLPAMGEEAIDRPDLSNIEGSMVPPEPAWERAGGGLPLGAAVETVKQIFTSPTFTFGKMPVTGGYVRPLLFYTLAGWVSGVVALCYQLTASLINPTMFLGEAAGSLSSTILVLLFAGTAVFLPVFLVFGLFVSASFFHFGLMLTGGANKPFEATFRAVAYAGGATSTLQLLPLLGGYLYPLASLVYSVIALREVHRTELWRVILAVVLLLVFTCGVALVAVAGIAALLAVGGK